MKHTTASPTARTSAHTLPSEHIRRQQFRFRVASRLRAIKESALAAEIAAQYAQEDVERLEHKLADIQCWLRERTEDNRSRAMSHSWSRMATDCETAQDIASAERLLQIEA